MSRNFREYCGATLAFNIVKARSGALLLAGVLLAALPAGAGSIASRTAPDPLLDPPQGPCAALAGGTDYAAGTDADGHPVVPADAGAPPVPVPGDIAMPLGGGRRGDPAYVQLDGKKLAPLVNPPACPH